jgi:RND family efflux transporter MFP subunit
VLAIVNLQPVNNTLNGSDDMNGTHPRTPSMLWLVASALAFLGPLADAAEIESFTEPYRRVAVPAPEVGTLSELLAAEGDAVQQDQLLARMDDTVLIASLEVARAAKDAEGSLRAAEATVKARRKQLDSYAALRDRGNATQREMDRAENDHIQSLAQLQSVREELEVRRLEFEKIKAQLQHRKITSPINGFVVAIDKEAGEFVSPTDPIVMHVVQLDTLKSVFSVPLTASRGLKAGQQVTVDVGTSKLRCQGVIEFVSPTADAQSESVRVKIRIPNSDRKIQSGAVCVWDLKSAEPREQLSRKTNSYFR